MTVIGKVTVSSSPHLTRFSLSKAFSCKEQGLEVVRGCGNSPPVAAGHMPLMGHNAPLPYWLSAALLMLLNCESPWWGTSAVIDTGQDISKDLRVSLPRGNLSLAIKNRLHGVTFLTAAMGCLLKVKSKCSALKRQGGM